MTLTHQWAALADPAGTINANERDGIVSGESAEFSKDGQYIVTTSKSDNRDNFGNRQLTGGTSHLRLFDLQGNLLWDKPRHAVPVAEDELEVASVSRDDLYIAAGGDDQKVEIWQYRDLATRQVLADPILVKTFDAEIDGGVDSMMYSHSGDLLFVGTEAAGRLEVFRVQGDPSTWVHIHTAFHGGVNRQSVNSVGLSQDDQYVGTAGTNATGGLWSLDLVRDSNGLITDVDMTRLASMNEPTATTREIRFQPDGDLVALSSERDQATFIYDLQQLLTGGTPTSSPPPVQTLRNFNTSIGAGNSLEPVAFSGDGRFLVTPGDTNGDVEPAFFRIYETAEIIDGAPEPDPVYVQHENVRNTEYFDFSPDNTQLTTSHQDGSVRLWDVTISGSETIASEAFNETTAAAGRWTIQGDATNVGTIGDVQHNKPFRGHRGSRYLAINDLNNNSAIITLDQTWDLTGYTDLQVQFAAAAAVNEFEGNDYLRLLADADGDDVFETLIAEFLPQDGELVMSGTGQRLDLTFTDFFIDLEPLLPADFNDAIRFQIQAWNSSDNEEIGFDSLRVTGVIPEPASFLLLVPGVAGFIAMRRR